MFLYLFFFAWEICPKLLKFNLFSTELGAKLAPLTVERSSALLRSITNRGSNCNDLALLWHRAAISMKLLESKSGHAPIPSAPSWTYVQSRCTNLGSPTRYRVTSPGAVPPIPPLPTSFECQFVELPVGCLTCP